jgi:hypothetical protein
MTAVIPEQSVTQVGVILDAIVGRLAYDEDFAASLAKTPYETLDEAGLHMDKGAVESFVKNNSERFDKICDRLAELINPDILAMLAEPTCG